MWLLLSHSFHNPSYFMLSYLIRLHNNIPFLDFLLYQVNMEGFPLYLNTTISKDKVGTIISPSGRGHIKLYMHFVRLTNKFLGKSRITKG